MTLEKALMEEKDTQTVTLENSRSKDELFYMDVHDSARACEGILDPIWRTRILQEF